MKGLVLTPEQHQQQQDAANQQMMRQQLLGSASQAIPKVIEGAVKESNS